MALRNKQAFAVIAENKAGATGHDMRVLMWHKMPGSVVNRSVKEPTLHCRKCAARSYFGCGKIGLRKLALKPCLGVDGPDQAQISNAEMWLKRVKEIKKRLLKKKLGVKATVNDKWVEIFQGIIDCKGAGQVEAGGSVTKASAGGSTVSKSLK